MSAGARARGSAHLHSARLRHSSSRDGHGGTPGSLGRLLVIVGSLK
ncbi:hypothetical protein [Streptomyces sp. NPDC052107]